MTPLHAAALAYAAQGVPVFPLQPGGKEPATGHSFKDATTVFGQINAWWIVANYNIGTEPAASGQCVIDIDNKNDKQGNLSWRTLCAEHGDPPQTRMVRTPNGGWHIYFTGTLPPSVNRLGDGIDVRSSGSYVVLPPSVLPEGTYWAMTDLTVAAMPAWLRTLGEAPKVEVAIAPENVEIDPDGIEEWAIKLINSEIDDNGPAEIGNGVNDRRFRLACLLKDGPRYGVTMSEGLACELLTEYWMDTPRTEQTVRNAYRLSGHNAPGCGPIGDPIRKYGTAYLEQDAPKRIKLWRPSDMMNMPPIGFYDPAEQMLPRVEGGYTGIWWGFRGHHKTNLLLTKLLTALVDHSELRVLYLIGEGKQGLGSRLRAHYMVRGLAQDALDERFRAFHVPMIHRPEEVAVLYDALEQDDFAPRIVVMDTLATAIAGLDEDNKTASLFTERGPVGQLAAKLNTLLLFVGHTGEDRTKGNRGGGGFVNNSGYSAIVKANHDHHATALEISTEAAGGRAKDWTASTAYYEIASIMGVPIPQPVDKRTYALLSGAARWTAQKIGHTLASLQALDAAHAVSGKVVVQTLYPMPDSMDPEAWDRCITKLAGHLERQAGEFAEYHIEGAWFIR